MGGETLELRTQDGTFVTQITADSDGNFTIDTSTVDAGEPLDPGFYRLEDSDGNVLASNFEIVQQSFNIEQNPTSVNDAGDSTTTQTTWSSNRGDYEVAVTVTVGGSIVEASTIDALTAESASDTRDLDGDGTAEAAIFSGGDQTINWDFDGATPADYNVQVSVTDTTSSGSTTVTVNDLGDSSVGLVSNTVRQNQGDIASVNISFDNTDTAYLSVGGLDAGYLFNATITDDNGDGYAVVNLNTYTAGANRGGILASVDSGSSADVNETNLPGIIAQGDYEIGVDRNNVEEATNDPDNVGTLFVRPRSTDSIQLWRSAKDVTGLDTVAEIQSSIEDGSLSQSTSYNAGDTQVHQIQASGLEGLIANKTGADATDKFAQAIVDGDISLTLTQTEDSTRQNRGPKTLNATEAIINDDLVVVPAPSADTYFVVVNTETPSFERSSTTGFTTLSSGDVVDVQFSVLEGSDIASSTETVTTQFDVGGASASLSEDSYTLQADSGQTISGTSTFAAGSTVSLKVESEDPNNPFVDRQDATVQPDGTFSADFDLSDLPEGTELTITLTDPAGGTDTATGQIAQPASFEVSNLDAPASAQIGDTATVTADVTNVGDVEGTVTAEFVFAGDVLTSQEVTVAGGDTETVTFEIPVSEEIPPGTYEHGVQAGDGSQFAEITIEEAPTETPTVTPTTAEPTTAEPTTAEPTTAEPTTAEPTTAEPTTAEPDETTEPMDGTTAMGTTAEGTDTGTPSDGDGGQPGFGLGLGIVALLAAALLALRRRD